MLNLTGLLARWNRRYWRRDQDPDEPESVFDVARHVVDRLHKDDVTRLLLELDTHGVKAGDLDWKSGAEEITVLGGLRSVLASGLGVIAMRSDRVIAEDTRRFAGV